MATPALTWTAYAYAKARFLLSACETEIYAALITDRKNPLLVVDLLVPKQEASWASCEPDDNDLALIYASLPDDLLCKGWFHTHPPNVHSPSGTDLDTQTRCFGNYDYSFMVIFAKDGWHFCRYHTGAGSPIPLTLDLETGPNYVDWANVTHDRDPDFSLWAKDLLKVTRPTVVTTTAIGYTQPVTGLALNPQEILARDAKRWNDEARRETTPHAYDRQDESHSWYRQCEEIAWDLANGSPDEYAKARALYDGMDDWDKGIIDDLADDFLTDPDQISRLPNPATIDDLE